MSGRRVHRGRRTAAAGREQGRTSTVVGRSGSGRPHSGHSSGNGRGRSRGIGRGARRPPLARRGDGRPPLASAATAGETEGVGSENQQNFTEEGVLITGLGFVGFDERRTSRVCNATNMERFKSFFGIGPAACAALLQDLSRQESAGPIVLKYFFMMLYWLQTYDIEIRISGWWKVHVETARTWCWYYAKRIQELKGLKIVFGDWDTDQLPIFLVSVDGVHCRTFERRKEPTAKIYSHKSEGPGLAYELGIAVYENRLVWINGPFDAGVSDIEMFRNKDDLQNSLKERLPPGSVAVGDAGGYQGESGQGDNTKTTIPRSNHPPAVKKHINRIRGRHENFNARIKNFQILAERFRGNDKDQHKIVFEAVCILCQYDMENGHPLFEV